MSATTTKPDLSASCLAANLLSRTFLRLALPIEVSKVAKGGHAWKKTTTTQLISPNGATFCLSRKLDTLEQVSLRFGERRIVARIVGQTGVSEHGYCYAVTFGEANPRFWGVAFPTHALQDETMNLQCGECRNQVEGSINEIESLVLQVNRQLQLPCASCGIESKWTEAPGNYSQANTATEPFSHESAAASLDHPVETEPDLVPLASMCDQELFRLPQKIERRRHKRLNLSKAKACIEQPLHGKVIAEVVNVSKSGACIRTEANYDLGSWVRIAVPYTIGGHNIFQSGRVTRVSSAGSRHEYGIEYVRLI
jgi:endogenous inhibitor of DNA gyrase (YacG/DUF329 family)